MVVIIKLLCRRRRRNWSVGFLLLIVWDMNTSGLTAMITLILIILYTTLTH